MREEKGEDEEVDVVTEAAAAVEATAVREVVDLEGAADSFQIFIQKKYFIKKSHSPNM